jgi:phosphatidylserine/phosphatidylglycerophosphate/cardiolipin synthase-like enzyme
MTGTSRPAKNCAERSGFQNSRRTKVTHSRAGSSRGPDEAFDRARWAIIAGLDAAQHSARVFTPYFIPDAALISALNAAAMRGVEVDIFLPQQTDLPHVHWAAFAQLWQVLEHGCRIWWSPGPFDHSKLMVVEPGFYSAPPIGTHAAYG